MILTIISFVAIITAILSWLFIEFYKHFRKNNLREITATIEGEKVSNITRAFDKSTVSYTLSRTAKRGGHEYVFHIYTYSAQECIKVKKILKINSAKFTKNA